MDPLQTSYELDRRWHWLRGDMPHDHDRSKQPALEALARTLNAAATPWAIIGGIAVQLSVDEPRTTLDINVVVLDRAELPVAAVAAAGFSHVGSFGHSDNWRGPGEVPVQLTDDPPLVAGLVHADRRELDGLKLPVLAVADLVRAKLRAAADPARRRSKQLRDLADVAAMLEAHPEVAGELSEDERALLARWLG